MKYQVVIPSRFASTRLPGKPLADIHGQTMVERVYRQACQSTASSVVVATDHDEVFKTVESFGGKVMNCFKTDNSIHRLVHFGRKFIRFHAHWNYIG